MNLMRGRGAIVTTPAQMNLRGRGRGVPQTIQGRGVPFRAPDGFSVRGMAPPNNMPNAPACAMHSSRIMGPARGMPKRRDPPPPPPQDRISERAAPSGPRNSEGVPLGILVLVRATSDMTSNDKKLTMGTLKIVKSVLPAFKSIAITIKVESVNDRIIANAAAVNAMKNRGVTNLPALIGPDGGLVLGLVNIVQYLRNIADNGMLPPSAKKQAAGEQVDALEDYFEKEREAARALAETGGNQIAENESMDEEDTADIMSRFQEMSAKRNEMNERVQGRTSRLINNIKVGQRDGAPEGIMDRPARRARIPADSQKPRQPANASQNGSKPADAGEIDIEQFKKAFKNSEERSEQDDDMMAKFWENQTTSN